MAKAMPKAMLKKGKKKVASPKMVMGKKPPLKSKTHQMMNQMLDSDSDY